MLLAKKKISVTPEHVSSLIENHYASLMQSFYEVQSSFLSGIYKRYGDIETANIVLCFSRNVHLEIIRQREKDLNFNVSLENFWKNFNTINLPKEKITSVVRITGLPKETVRRKINNLTESGILLKNKQDRSYRWNLSEKDKYNFIKIIDVETLSLSKFISKIVNDLDLIFSPRASRSIINEEIRSQFSFYWYHYLSCQLDWLKWWQLKLKDIDLLLIALQVTIPSLQFIDKTRKNINANEIFKIIGQVNKNQLQNCSISATAVSDVTGIPRATAIRKLDRLVNLGFLVREAKNKRYAINQAIEARTKNIMSNDNVSFTIKTFSEYISIILNSLIQNRL